MATLRSSSAFWDQKAKENAPWYISSYGPYAGRNEAEFWESGRHIWTTLKARCGYTPRRTDVVAEIGCGIGRLTKAIAPDVGAVHAFDISAEMVRQAQLSAPPNASFHVTSGSSLSPLESKSVDVVLAYCVLQHLPDYDVLGAYLQEMARVARPGALVAFTTVPRDWRTWLLPAARLKAAILSPFKRGGPRDLYKKEWIGIRPSRSLVTRLCPIHVEQTVLDSERWLFWGRVP